MTDNRQLSKALLACAANCTPEQPNIPWASGMVPRICRYKWHSNGLKARILGAVFYCLYSICEVCRLGHTKLSTAVFWVKKRKVAGPKRCHHRPPFLKRCWSLRAWFTQTTCCPLRTCALASLRRASHSRTRPPEYETYTGNTFPPERNFW